MADLPPNQAQPPVQQVIDAAEELAKAKEERERVARELEKATIANNQPTTSEPK